MVRDFLRRLATVTRPVLSSIALLAALPATTPAAEPVATNVVLGIHGGIAGDRDKVTPEREKILRAELRRALEAGQAQLKKPGATSLDAVEAAIRLLEDSPEFNAGKGAVFTHEGRNELDASIMEGSGKKAGAVGGVCVIKNPITAARAVMERSKHVLLVGRGAEVFATKIGLEIVDPAYFWTEPRWKQIQEVWRKEAEAAKAADEQQARVPLRGSEPWSTVGAVALDPAGDLAAGTSTGGMSNKMFGRLGDSPIIGAGTYADNEGCAVSATGHGEYFIRYAVAHEISCLIKYKQMSVDAAASQVINGKLKPAGGEGGVIALDAKGNFSAPFNTEGMYRGYVTRDGKIKVMLYEQ